MKTSMNTTTSKSTSANTMKDIELNGLTETAPHASGVHSPFLKRAMWSVGAGLGVVAVLFYYTQYVAPFESTDNAFIEAHIAPIAPQVPGRVVNLCVEDNQKVKKGDVLLQIDPSDYEARRAQAAATVEAAKSRHEQAKAQLAVAQTAEDQARAGVTAAEAEASRAQAELKRYQSVESRSVSRSQVDIAETQARSSVAQADVARAKLQEAQAQVGLAKAGIQSAAADILQSEAVLRQAELNLSYTRITAPDDGRVTRRVVENGAYIQPGQLLMAIVPPQYWVIANFKEIQLTHMRVGQPVEVVVDAYPDRTFKGHVESIQSGAGARFSLFPPENATGNYIKVVQRVPVKIVLDDLPASDLALGPGMSVVPKVRVK